MTFTKGHSLTPRGSGHYNWGGGRKVSSRGYILLYRPDHHFADYKGYVSEHRLVFEEQYNCCLLTWTDIHHRDGDVDNNIWYNLRPMMRGQHMRAHKKGKHKIENRICVICGSSKTSINRRLWSGGQLSPIQSWYADPAGGWICHKCYGRRPRRKNYDKAYYMMNREKRLMQVKTNYYKRKQKLGSG